jgi:hypothetical protein
LAKEAYTAFPAGRGLTRELFRVSQHGKFGSGDRCTSVVVDDSLDQQIILGFFTETLRMVPDSIVALVGL